MRKKAVSKNKKSTPKKGDKLFELVWRNKFLTVNAKSFKSMVKKLEKAGATLKAIQETGKVKLVGGVTDDYATFVTSDPAVAKKYGFEEVEECD